MDIDYMETITLLRAGCGFTGRKYQPTVAVRFTALPSHDQALMPRPTQLGEGENIYTRVAWSSSRATVSIKRSLKA
jgi:hypothetical protein